MKDKTAQNVIMSVYRPIDKILASLMVTIFVCYIFAFYMFIYFPTEQQDGHFDCATLFGCSIFSINYGIRAGEGLGEEMEHNLGQRWLFDVIFFFAITTGIFNLVAGVIITSFSQMTEEKNERKENTTGTCFICGIERTVFDRAANSGDGFKEHITEDHHMWNYLYVPRCSLLVITLSLLQS